MNENNVGLEKALFTFQLSLDMKTARLHLDNSVNSKEGLGIIIQSVLDIALKTGYLDGTEVTIRDVFEKLDFLEKKND